MHGTQRKSLLTKNFSFVVNFLFYIYIYLLLLCVNSRYLVLQKIARPCYAVTRSMPTSQVYYSGDTKESCTKSKCWM